LTLATLPALPDLPVEISPEREAARLAALRRYAILEAAPDASFDASFDRITSIAAKLFDAPIAIISMVDDVHIRFKSHHGLDIEGIERAAAILRNDPWLWPGAKPDARSLSNPLTANDLGLQFYLSTPLRTLDGFNLGTLCVMDYQPRAATQEQIDRLADLASVVMDNMDLRLSARRAMADYLLVGAQKDAALRRAELMAKEVDHRVMNSLQLTSSILSLQARGVSGSEASEQLMFAARRVAAIAQAHQHIYLDIDAEGANCRDYLQRLCADVSGLLGDSGADLAVESVEVEISTRQIVPLGLLVNELVTNAAKYGGGAIRVLFTGSGGDYELTVMDEGPGLPDGFNPNDRHGLGMKVILALTRQLGGDLRFGPGPSGRGASFTIAFKVVADAD
jgi:two-component sensor histidine kinase